MTSDLRIQGEVVVNSEQAEGAFNRVGDKAQQMANEVATSAGKAGQAVDKIGDGAGASAEKFTRAESRISASIKRATNELELLGKTASQRLEFNISDKGLDAAKFEPALKKLREIEAQALQAQRAATGSLDKMGLSAKQTAAALRGVPAQFTDIVTSLQGGQAPLTVFLQQGGQLKDMFGGAGNAARALGGYVLGLVNPLTIAAAAAGALAFAYNQGSKEADAYNKALITTGNAAGTNAAQLKAYAQEISGIVGTQGKAAESLAALASTGKVGAESLRDAAKAAVEYERATGQAVGKTAEQFASLRNEPLAAVLKLNDGMNFLTVSTYKQIKSLEEQGKTAEAANVAQRAFADTLSNRAGEMERNLGAVERGWVRIKDAAKGAWDAILNVGRATTSVDQLSEVRRQIAQRENQIANAGFGSNEGGAAFGRPSIANTERLRAELSGLQAQAAALEGVAFATRTAAEEEGKRVELSKALIQFDKEGDQFKQKSAKRDEEVGKAETEGRKLILAGLLTEKDLRERIADINKKYEDKGASAAINKEQSAYASLVAAITEKIKSNELELEFSGRLTESDKLRIKLTAELNAGSKTLTAEHRASALALLDKLSAQEKEEARIKSLVAEYKQEAEIAEELAQAYVAQDKARAAGRVGVQQYAVGIDESNKALQYELSLMGLGEQARNVALEQYRIELDLKKQIAAIDANTGFDEVQREEERAKARAAAAIASANASNKVFLDEWKESVSKYDDIFRKGFADMLNNGKDGWKSFTKSLATTFKTTVADAIYKSFAQPFVVKMVGSLMGVFGGGGGGIGGAVAGAAGGSNPIGMASNAYSFYNAGSQALTLGSQYLGGTMSGANAMGTMFANGTGTGISGLLSTNAGYGTMYSAANAAMPAAAPGMGAGAGGSSMGALGAAGIFAAVAIAIGNVMGVFRSDRRNGGGIAGTLGSGDLYAWEERRDGGTFIDGPDFETQNLTAAYKERQRVRAENEAKGKVAAVGSIGYGEISYMDYLDKEYGQYVKDAEVLSKTLQTAFDAVRKSVGSMADTLGLSKEAVMSFTTSLGGEKGLNFDGLDATGQQNLVAQALATANNEIAQQLIGTWEKFTTTVLTTIPTGYGSAEEGQMVQTWDTIATTTDGMRYVASEYAKEGEKAIDTLTRLATSFATVRDLAADMRVPFELAGLAGADAASKIADAFGGLEPLVAQMSSYIDNYYSETEKRENLARRSSEVLQGVGLNVSQEDILGSSRIAVRGFVEDVLAKFGPSSPQYVAAVQQANALAGLYEPLGNAAAAAASVMGEAMKRLQSETAELQIELLRAQGNISGANAAQRTLDTTGLGDAEIAVYDYNESLRAQIRALEDIASASERAVEAERDLIEARAQTAEESYSQAASGTDSALSAIGRAVGAQREIFDAAQRTAIETAQEVQSLIDTLSSGIKGLYGEVESARTASAAEGMAFIENALRNARATGYLPESAALNDAITSARGGMGDRQYASQADQDFDRLVLAGQLKELTGYAEPQLTAAEQAARSAEDQIKALDDILRNARDQVDELRGIDTSVKSIPEALAALQVALVAESQAQTQSFLAGIVAGLSSGNLSPQEAIQRYEGKDGEVIPREKWVDLAGTQSYISSGGAVALGGNAQSGLDAVVTGKTGTQFTVRSAVDYVNEAMRTGDLRAVYNAAVMHGISSTSLDAMMGWPGGTALDWAKSQGLPAFAVGTNYVPRDMVARIHEGEAIVPKAYNPAAGGMGGQSNARMEALLEKLAAEFAELKGLQRDSNRNTRRTAEAVNGNPDAPMLVQTV